MKTMNLIIVCITVLLSVGIITYGIVINEIYETPYEQCLKTCRYSDKIHCAKVCTSEIGEVVNNIVNKLSPIIEKVLECEEGGEDGN